MTPTPLKKEKKKQQFDYRMVISYLLYVIIPFPLSLSGSDIASSSLYVTAAETMCFSIVYGFFVWPRFSPASGAKILRYASLLLFDL